MDDLEADIDANRARGVWFEIPAAAQQLAALAKRESFSRAHPTSTAAHSYYWTVLAEYCASKGNDSDAESYLAKALDFEPSYPDALVLSARYQLLSAAAEHEQEEGGRGDPGTAALALLARLNPPAGGVTPHRARLHQEGLLLRARLQQQRGDVASAADSARRCVDLAPGSALAREASLLLPGLLLRERGRVGEAVAAWRRCLLEPPAGDEPPAQRVDALSGLARVLAWRVAASEYEAPEGAELGSALEEAAHLLQLQNDLELGVGDAAEAPPAALALGALLCRRGLPGAAARLLEGTLGAVRPLPQQWWSLALALEADGRHAAAVLALERCAELDAGAPYPPHLPLLQRAKLEMRFLGDAAAAIEHARQALALCPEGDHAGGATRCLHVLGCALAARARRPDLAHDIRSELRAEALQAIDDAIALKADATGLQDAELQLHLALVLAEARQLNRAYEIVTSSLRLHSSAAGWNLLALLLSCGGEHKTHAAHTAVRQGLDDHPDDASLLLTKACVERRSGMAAKSLDTLRAVTAASARRDGPTAWCAWDLDDGGDAVVIDLVSSGGNSDDSDSDLAPALLVEALCERASLLAEEGDQSPAAAATARSAVDAARRVVDAAPQQDTHLRAMVLTAAAELQERAGDRGAAETGYARALAETPHHVPALVRLGALLLEGGTELARARAYLTSAIRIEAGSHDAWRVLGIVLQRQDEHEQAAEAFLTALELEKAEPLRPFAAVAREAAVPGVFS